MELINDLFRTRVNELEQSEQAAREMQAKLMQEIDALKRRLDERDELEDDTAPHKRPRLSDLIDDSRAGTPIEAMVE